MEKNITRQGPKTRQSYTVTLPKEWITTQKMEDEKCLEMENIGDKLILYKPKKHDLKEFIDLKEVPDSIIKVLNILYRKGIDEIKIKYYNEKEFEKINKIINSVLIGYEIIEQKKDYLIIKQIIDESNENFKVILRRAYLLLMDLCELKNKELLNTSKNNLKKLLNYCQRIIIKKGHEEYQKIPFYYLLLDQLEKISDELNWIISIDEKYPILKLILSKIRETYELFYSFSIKKFNKLSFETYNLKNNIKLQKNPSLLEVYSYNIYRLLNSISGTIYAINA